MELDETDRKLLNLLQGDAKAPYAKLAKRLGISSSGIHKRVRRLIDAGVIKKFIAVVDHQIIGKKLKAFIGISTSPGTCGEVITHLSRRPEVLEIHEVAGEHDLFVKLITDDTLKLNELLHEMDRIPGVSSSRTLIVLKTEKETSAVALTS
ncbi:MAG: Lrp/AsnC family transcriptional regulator [Candidatus Hodarchaeaceae archaeon]|nr:Lrp/AsnC family transcriptional regulator [Candidatus Hodarchaeaceae archaeon]